MRRMPLFVSIVLCLALLFSVGTTSVFATEESQENTRVENWGMALNDEIIMKFNMVFAPEILEDAEAYVEVTVGSRSYNVPVAQITGQLCVPVLAMQMTDTISLCVVDGNGVRSELGSSTVRQYCDTLLGSAAYASYHQLVKEVLNYGSAAQLYFEHNTGNLAGDGIEGAGQQEVLVTETQCGMSDTSEVLQCHGASLVYRDKIALRFYFGGSLEGCDFAVSGAAGEPVVNAQGGYVEVADILPRDFDKVVTLTATDAQDGAVSIRYCPMDYIIRMSVKGSDATKVLVKALYNYHLVAKDFVPVESFDVAFDLNYANATGTPEAIEIPVGDTYGTLPAPTRVGYTFGGWYTDAACSGEAVAADTLVISSHTLYAKWTIVADTSVLLPKYDVEPLNTAVSRDFIDGKDTIIFTTEGKTLINTGWQRRLEFVNSDTSKEIVKFRFKYVSNNNASGEAVDPALNYLVGGLDTSNYGHFVVTDESGNVVNGLTTGTWYTFWGLTQGNSKIVLYPCNTTEQLRMTLYIQDRELLDYEPAISLNQTAHAYYGSTAPYQDAEGNWLYHHRSFTGEHHNNATDYRKTFITTGETYDVISFEFKYNVATHIAAGAEPVTKLGFAYLNGATYFDMNGNPVTAANMTLGNWYKAYVQVASEFDGGWHSGWFAAVADINGNTANGVSINIDMDYRNIVGYAADTNPITITSRDKNNLVTTYLGDGMYNINTITASSPGTAAWQWAAMVTAPDNTHTNMAVTFRFNAAYAADGVTPIDASMSIWRGTDSGSGVSAQIYDVETGAMVSSDNGLYKALEIGKWYTVAITNPAGALQTQYRLTPCFKYSGAAKFSIDIADRLVYTSNGITMTTPQGLADPAMRYTEEDGWHYYIANNGATLTAEQRQAYVQIPQDGANQLTYEVKINNVSGNATPKVGIITGHIRYYELDGTLVGTQNSVSLETGKWYKVEMSKNEGANLGTSWLFGFIGDASNNAGNVSASFRNFAVSYPMTEVTFDLNYTGATNAPAKREIIQGYAYGELPAPTRAGFTFGGWYTDAACSGEAITAETIVTATHSVYAKWTLAEDTNPLQPSYTTEINFTSVSRDVVDTLETIIYTTNGKGTPTEGDYQRRLQFNIGDTAKEVVKFRFKFVTYNDAEGNPVTPKIDFYAGGVTSGYRGHYTVTDDSGNVVTELATGTWYTFYGLHRGNAVVSFWPTYQYGKNDMDVTLYVQDRELLDFEQDIYLTQGDGHAYNGRLAPYKDADGNWAYHFYSYGATHGNNGAWQRRTILNVPTTYSHAAFEFKFNVADYGAVGEELASHVTNGFGGTALAYYELDGTPVAAANLVTGKWYRAIVTAPAATNTLYAMGNSTNVYDSTNKVYTHTANIDMEYRNFVGHVSDGYTVSTPDTFADPSFVYTSDDGWYQYIPDNGAAITAWARRTSVTIPTDGATKLSYEAKLNSISGDATSAIYVVGARGQEIYDLETGELLGTNNSVTLELGKWYRFVTYKSDNSNLGTNYEFCYPGDGSHNAGNCSVSFRNFEAIYPES